MLKCVNGCEFCLEGWYLKDEFFRADAKEAASLDPRPFFNEPMPARFESVEDAEAWWQENFLGENDDGVSPAYSLASDAWVEVEEP